jgi:DNA-binding NtrC family response regulator
MAAKFNSLIFVVEDNKVYNKLITEYLKKQNFTKVKPFFSGEECVKAVEQGELPDIVIQDYFLEGMNGIDVLQKVKKLSPKSDFIFLTGHDNIEVAVNTIKFGAFDYIIKDKVTLDKVVDRIQKIRKVKLLEKQNKQIKMFMILFGIVIFIIVVFFMFYFRTKLD